MIRNIAKNNLFIISLLLGSIIVYCFFYEQSNTGLSLILSQLEQDITRSVSNEEIELYRVLSDAITSMYVQIPVNFISSLLNIYISGFFIFIVIKIEQRIRKSPIIKLKFVDIVSYFYKSLYIIILSFLIQATIMLVAGMSVDNIDFVYYIVYWLTFITAQGIVFLYFLRKHIQGYRSPVIMYFFIVGIQLTAMIILEVL